MSTLEESRKKKRKINLAYLYKQSNLPAHGTQETTFWKVPSPLLKTPLPSPFPKAKKKKNIPSHSRNHYFGKGVRKIILERGSSFGREEIKYLIFLLPLLKFSHNIIASHFTQPHSTLERKKLRPLSCDLIHSQKVDILCALMWILTMVHYYQHTSNTIQRYFEWYDTSKSKYDSHITI